MQTAKNFIELNGKRYNALTGEMLDSRSEDDLASQSVFKTKKPMTQANKALDGVGHQVPAATNDSSQLLESKNKTEVTLLRRPHSRTIAPHATHRTPQRSKTLMRKAVKKPLPSQARSHHSTSPLQDRNPLLESSHKTVISSSIQNRVERALRISKSSLISKFEPHKATLTKKTAPLRVKDAPDHIPHKSQHIVTPTKQYMNTTSSPFIHAMEHANSHRHSAPKHHKLHARFARRVGVSNKVASLISGTLAMLILGSFIAFQNMPNLAIRVASARAGFGAEMPDYRPSGFALANPISYRPGEVTISFKSNSDTRAYQITQKPSNWNTETLLEKFVATKGQPYQTFQEKGRTIFINDSNATWVDSGVLYQVAGNSSLTSDQLLRIASSL